MPSGPCGPRCSPRRRARSSSLKRPSGFRWSAIRWPSLTTTPASSLVACRTSARSASATSVGETQRGQHVDGLAYGADMILADRARFYRGRQLRQLRLHRGAGQRAPRPDPGRELKAANDLFGCDAQPAHSISRTAGMHSPPSGGSAISPKNRYIRPRFVRSCVSNRSATSTRKLLPTTSEPVSRSTSCAASIASRAAPIRSRASSALTHEPIPRRYEPPLSKCRARDGDIRGLWMKPATVHNLSTCAVVSWRWSALFLAKSLPDVPV